MSFSLRELVANYKVLESLEDMDEQARTETLDSLRDSIDVKAENIAYVIRDKDLEVDVIKTEIKRLQDRAKAVENARDRLKEYLEEQLTFAGLDKVKTPTLTVALQKNPPSVFVEDENMVPEQYVNVEIIRKVDRKSLLQALKEGEVITGCTLKQSRSLRIK